METRWFGITFCSFNRDRINGPRVWQVMIRLGRKLPLSVKYR